MRDRRSPERKFLDVIDEISTVSLDEDADSYTVDISFTPTGKVLFFTITEHHTPSLMHPTGRDVYRFGHPHRARE